MKKSLRIKFSEIATIALIFGLPLTTLSQSTTVNLGNAQGTPGFDYLGWGS